MNYSKGNLDSEVSKLMEDKSDGIILKWIPSSNIMRRVMWKKEESKSQNSILRELLNYVKLGIPRFLTGLAFNITGTLEFTHVAIFNHLGKVLHPIDVTLRSYQAFSLPFCARESAVEYAVPLEKVNDVFKALESLIK